MNYQQTKGVRISLHASLTSVRPNSLPEAALRVLGQSLLTQTWHNTPPRMVGNHQRQSSGFIQKEKIEEIVLEPVISY